MKRERRTNLSEREWEQITSSRPVVRRVPNAYRGALRERVKAGRREPPEIREFGMTDRREQDREQREREEEHRIETERRAEKLRQSWRERHPSEEEAEKRPKRGKP